MRKRIDSEHERGTDFRAKQRLFIPVVVVAGVFAFSGVVMYLWNAILPDVLGVHTLTYWQALGILVLSKILFGGFKGISEHHRSHIHQTQEMRAKWMNMNAEEKEKLRKEWGMRFGHQEKPE